MHHTFALRGAAALCAVASLAVPVLSRAAGMTPEAMHRVAAMDRRAALGEVATPRSQSTAAGPTLTAFHADASVNAALSGAQLKVTLSATGASAGITEVSIYAVSPNGQRATYAGPSVGFPSNDVTTTVGLTFGVYSQPGTWTITQVVLYDDAGNYTVYDHDQVAALGDASFTVTNANPRALDLTPPTLVGGRILTPTVKLTPGANPIDTWAGVQVKLTDAGNPASSGFDWADTVFCTLDRAHCIWLGWGPSVLGQSGATPRMGTNLANLGGSVVPGTYWLDAVMLHDIAGNATTLTSRMFGGSTDFSTYFPAGQSFVVTD